MANQPTPDLPDYDGRPVGGMKTSISGSGTGVTAKHSIGDRLVLVTEVVVKKAGHEEVDDDLIYVEALKVLDLFEVEGEAGRALLSAHRSAYRTAEDERLGRLSLPIYDIYGDHNV